MVEKSIRPPITAMRFVLTAPIIHKQAPCQPDGVILSEGEEESKEGTCSCQGGRVRCCVDGIGRVLPLILK